MYQPISKGEVHTMHYAYTYTYTPLFSMILPILALLLILAGGIALSASRITTTVQRQSCMIFSISGTRTPRVC